MQIAHWTPGIEMHQRVFNMHTATRQASPQAPERPQGSPGRRPSGSPKKAPGPAVHPRRGARGSSSDWDSLQVGSMKREVSCLRPPTEEELNDFSIRI